MRELVFAMSSATDTIQEFVSNEYKYGFVSDIDTETLPPGLNEEVIRTISAKKTEPDFMLQWRLRAYRYWLTQQEPTWQQARYAPMDYQKVIYYAAPRPRKSLNSLDEVDPELLKTFEKLGISLGEQKRLMRQERCDNEHRRNEGGGDLGVICSTWPRAFATA